MATNDPYYNTDTQQWYTWNNNYNNYAPDPNYDPNNPISLTSLWQNSSSGAAPTPAAPTPTAPSPAPTWNPIQAGTAPTSTPTFTATSPDAGPGDVSFGAQNANVNGTNYVVNPANNTYSNPSDPNMIAQAQTNAKQDQVTPADVVSTLGMGAAMFAPMLMGAGAGLGGLSQAADPAYLAAADTAGGLIPQAASQVAPSLSEALSGASSALPDAVANTAPETISDGSSFLQNLPTNTPIPNGMPTVLPEAPLSPIPSVGGSSLLDNPLVNKALQGGVSGAVTSAIQGQNPLQGAASGAIGGGVSGGASMASDSLSSVLNDLGLGSVSNGISSGLTNGIGSAISGGLNSLVGSAVNGSTNPVNGSTANPTQNFTTNLLNSLISQYGYNQASNANQTFMNNLNSLYSPNSAYAQTLQKQLDARDAATGRRSQYGPRAVELQANLANAAQRNSGVLSQALATQNNLLSGNLRNWGTTMNNSGIPSALSKGLTGLFNLPSSGNATVAPTSTDVNSLYSNAGYGDSTTGTIPADATGLLGNQAQVDPFGNLANSPLSNQTNQLNSLTGNIFGPPLTPG
jgi:hypothetical protein